MNFSDASKYWLLITISLGNHQSYSKLLIPQAQRFFLKHFREITNQLDARETDIQAQLLEWLKTTEDESDRTTQAEINMRCRVSHAMLSACKRLANQFGVRGQFTYQELLPLVLLEDRQTLQKPITAGFIFDILQKYDVQRSNLESWVLRKVRQSPDVKDFLLNHDILHSSKWAVLTHRNSFQLADPSDQPLLQAFRAVYQRDRQQNCSSQPSKYQDPSQEQLKEMLTHLEHYQPRITSPQQLLQKLEQLSSILRQRRIELERKHPITISLDIKIEVRSSEQEITLLDQISNDYGQDDLSYVETGDETIKRSEFEVNTLEKLNEQMILALRQAMQAVLMNKPPLFKQALSLNYIDGLTQGKIAEQLGMRQDQISRVLKLEKFRSQIRELTLSHLTHYCLEEARRQGLVDDPDDPDYQLTLIENLADFIDHKIFRLAAAENMNSRKIERNSLFAQQLCQTLKEQAEP